MYITPIIPKTDATGISNDLVKKADEIYRGGYNDGRGKLSLKGLEYFLNFMLDTALNQVKYYPHYIFNQWRGNLNY